MSTVLAGSHIPVLVKLMQVVDKPVLELGIGYNSTPLLHWLCAEKNLSLTSYESDPKWMMKFNEFRTPTHEVHFVWTISDTKPSGSANSDGPSLDDQHWGLVLVDHRPALGRRFSAMKVKDNADYIVLHDSEPEIDRFYRYSSIYKHFKYRYDFTQLGKPFTTVLSNFKELEWLRN